MRRVVVTGMGVVSSIGSNKQEVLDSLMDGRSGLVYLPEMQELGLRASIFGTIKQSVSSRLSKRMRQTTSGVGEYAVAAALEAVGDSGLDSVDLDNERTGIVIGTCFGGINEVSHLHDTLSKKRSLSRAGGVGLVKFMHSTAASNIASVLGSKGRGYSLCSSFAVGTDSIGHAYELIKYGVQDVCVCGSAEEECWKQIGGYFDSYGGLARGWENEPSRACRPYERDRRGLVMSAGAGVLVLESAERASRRGAGIYAEIVGYAAANDGSDLFKPSGDGLRRVIRGAMASAAELGVESVDYINSHGTGTLVGDSVEVEALKQVFGGSCPPVSSTKGLTGHGLGAAGAQESVYCLLMLKNGFIAPTANLEHIADECKGIVHVQQLMEKRLEAIMSFNVGFGGTNSCIVYRKL